jgi:quercetin dioxygenase-like cupin family protein
MSATAQRLPMVANGDMGISISHQFSGTGYAKVYSAPAGLAIAQHKHKAGHDSHLLLGVVDVTVDGVTTRHEAPAVLHIEAGKAHQIVSVTDFLWACVWPDVDGITDPDQIDHEVIA